MEAALATRPSTPPARVLVAHHTTAMKDWDPDEGEIIVGYYSCQRITCRLHGDFTEADNRPEALRLGRWPEDWCEGCQRALGPVPPLDPGSEFSRTDAELERRERHPREGRCG